MKLALATALLALSAAAPPTDEDEEPPAAATVDEAIDALYRSVSFGPGGECDWELLRSLLIDGAVFVQPPRGDAAPRVLSTDDFVADFRQFIATTDVGTTGFHERVAARRVDSFGRVAHAYVVFEIRLGSESTEPVGRGLDSIQLVRDEDRWRVVSITTEHERPGRPLPGRFLESGAGAR